LNKRKIRRVNKYLVQWKEFTVENNMWKKKEDLRNAKELVDDFEGRLGAEVRQQVGIEKKVEKEEYRRIELPGKYMAKLLYGWNDRKFEDEYLKKLEKNWRWWKNDRKECEKEELE